MNKFLPIEKPQNWSDLALHEKVGYYKKHLTEEHSIYVDKLESKRIVKEILGDDIEVPNVIKILNDPNDLSLEDLKKNTVIKATHGSGWNIFINTEINTEINLLKYKKSLLTKLK